jgi:hypothetical protein
MTTFVACALSSGLVIEFAGTTVKLNGANEGLDPLNLPRNGMADDTAFRMSGYGLTRLDDANEAAFLGWVDEVTKAPDGKTPLKDPFAPIANGAIFWAGSEADLRKEANKNESKGMGLDPSKDLPADVETSDETKAAAKGK